ncbi:MAG TPA: hypothetical protein VKE42_04910, partial [Candidatus Cybelea sp.]|nr:hypothetical protein [Candidatus Cybelea sp.]
MTMLEAKSNGHIEPATRAWDANLQRIERRLAELGDVGEQRIVILRDALGEFIATELATRDRAIATLQKHIATLQEKLEQKMAVDTQIDEIMKRVDARQAARDEAKRGDKGDRGARGERGLR